MYGYDGSVAALTNHRRAAFAALSLAAAHKLPKYGSQTPAVTEHPTYDSSMLLPEPFITIQVHTPAVNIQIFRTLISATQYSMIYY